MPFRSVMMPREAGTTSLVALLEMERARFSLPWRIWASYSTAPNSSRKAAKTPSRIMTRRLAGWGFFIMGNASSSLAPGQVTDPGEGEMHQRRHRQ